MNLLNEMRGVSGVMLSAGVIILLGIILPNLTASSLVIAAIMFVGFAIGRVIGWMADGKPNKQIVQGLAFEVVLGGLNVFCLIDL